MNSHSELQDIAALLRSRIAFIAISSHDEKGVQQLLCDLVRHERRPLFKWSLTEGLARLDIEMPAQRLHAQPVDALGHIRAVREPGVYMLADMHPFLDDPLHIRLLKDIALDERHTLVLVSHEVSMPAELEKFSARVRLALPDAAELEDIVRQEARLWSQQNGTQVKTSPQALALLVRNMRGLPRIDVRRLARNAMADDGAITASDLPQVTEAKYRLLGSDGVLQFEYDSVHPDQVAGFSRLKQWLATRRSFFLGEVGAPGGQRPRGVLLLGVQGCGKSLAARSVAGSWGVPLLRFDAGALYDKYIGESERNLREALATAEVMAPCVLWIDEIEKGLAAGEGDQGTSRRILGTLLTWMSEQRGAVFLVATANDIKALPPELVRKGRFDEVFFVDLPGDQARAETLRIHLRRHGAEPGEFDLDALVQRSDGFSGAEIEQAVVSAYYAAHAKAGMLDTQVLLQELAQTRPLSVLMAEPVAQLRQWAQNRTVPCD
uniref:AAA family ATPase n=1 Tax=Marinobacterium profundum TaxID=1714300 RepID=UPI0008324D07|nr:AAA family ATPase [Marinobacterium profundum]